MGATHLDLDLDLDVYVDKIKLNNQSEAVCALNCRYKDGVDGEQKRTGATDSFPVGQNKTLDLNSLPELNELYNKGREVYVTAHVDVKAGKDDYADIWAKYKPNSEKGAEFTISGVIKFTDVGFNGLID